MAFKKITIVLFPDGTNRVKQLRLPRFLLFLIILLLISCTVFFTWIIRDYVIIKTQMPLLAQLQTENEQQKRQFIQLAEYLTKITQKMSELQEIDRKLKVKMVNLKINGNNDEIKGIGGSGPTLLSHDYSIATTHKHLVRLLHCSLDSLSNKMAVSKAAKTRLYKFLESQKRRLDSTPSIWPTKGLVSSRFGYRISPFTGEKDFHKAIDIAAKMNSLVVAPADGIVSSIRWERLPGKVLYIRHGYGLVTKYAHLQKVLVQRGQYVKRGEKVALVGNTGRSTGAHLHYEVHLNGVPTDPLRYVSINTRNLLTDRPKKKADPILLSFKSLEKTIYEISSPNGTFNTAQDITEGIIIGRRSTARDRTDFYRVRATGNTLILNLESSLKKRNNRFIATVFDADQRMLGKDLEKAGSSIILPVKPQTIHYIKVDLGHAPIEMPQYQLHLHFS
jgi:murein DD-endopeptidase MepM/ murein hydrolase activator NlpD